MKKVSIIIIHYNTPQYLQTCLHAIFKQTYKNLEVIFIDNNSPDSSGLEFVKDNYSKHKNLTVVDNGENLGYAKAGNQGIKMALESGASYIAITNPDIIYSPSYFEKVVARMNKDPKIAAITGKVYKYDFAKGGATPIIDTVGLKAHKNRRVADEGQGIRDQGQFDTERFIFGVSGACPLYRREALLDVEILGEYLDEDFFMYKEDVDISWRFLLYGWKCLYYSKAIAYHGRGTGVYKRESVGEVLAGRKHLSRFQKYYSFKNQLLMERKNELLGNFLVDFFPIMLKKLLRPFYVLFREPYLLKGYIQYFKQLPRILKKRKVIMANKRISAKEMGKWFSG